MIVIGIDQSYKNTAMVVFEDREVIDTKVIQTEKDDSNKHLDIFKRATFVADEVETFANKISPDKIVIEQLAYGGFGDATRDLAGLQFLIVSKLLNYTTYDIEIVPPNSLKKFATGSGRASKKEMLEAVRDKDMEWFNSVLVKNGKYDLADAYHLGLWGYKNGK